MSNQRADIVAMAQQFAAGGGVRSIAVSATRGDDLTIPEFLRRSKDEPPQPKPEKRLTWTKDMSFKDDAAGKAEDPGTAQLKAALERKAKEAEKAKKAVKAEDKIIRTRKRAKPETETLAADQAAETGDDTMATKTAKKPAAAKAAKGKAQPKKATTKTAKANARTPVGERARFDWTAAEEKAAQGKVPAHPDFSAPTHARFLPILKEIKEALKLADREQTLKALRAIKINPVSSTPKAMDRYRKLVVTALQAEAKPAS